MSQAGTIGGSGGGGDILAVVGQSSLVAPTITVTTVAGTATVEDRAWPTQYVVDASTTPGLRGTFTTITAAMNQAITDGSATNPSVATIYIRKGTYTENINIPSVRLLRFCAIAAETGEQVINGVIIDGNLTASANAVFWFENIRFQNSGGGDVMTFTQPTAQSCYFINCNVIGAPDIAGGMFVFNNSSVPSGAFSGTSQVTLEYCSSLYSGTYTVSDNSAFNIIDSGSNNTSSSIVVADAATCYIANMKGINDITGTTSGLVEVYNSITGPINFTGDLLYSNLSAIGTGNGGLITNAVTSMLSPTTAGNILETVRITGNYQVLRNDYYIGVGTRASPITITLPDTGNANLTTLLNQTFVFNDEAGLAATQSITIQPTGGTINGAANLVIGTANECVELIFDGTNYFTVR